MKNYELELLKAMSAILHQAADDFDKKVRDVEAKEKQSLADFLVEAIENYVCNYRESPGLLLVSKELFLDLKTDAEKIMASNIQDGENYFCGIPIKEMQGKGKFFCFSQGVVHIE